MILLLVLSLSADAGRKNKAADAPVPERPIIEQPQMGDTFTAGSLWSEVPARQMMGLDGSARRVGDLITVVIRERTATQLDADTSTTRSSESSTGISALLGAETGLLAARPGMNGAIGISGGNESSHTGSGNTARGATLQATLTAEVVDVLPNGNLRVWGYKQVRVNREVQYVVLDGIARPRDIRMDNTVPSELLAQASIEVTGSGVIADKQGPGWGARVLDAIWPF